MALAPTTTKRCPGVAPLDIPAHELAATSENFVSNKGNRDGLATRCKVCGKAYQQAWSKAKREGTPFSARTPRASASATTPAAEERLAQGLTAIAAEEPAAPRSSQPTLGPSDRPGWGTSTVAGVQYPIPTGAAQVGSPEGQEALDAVNRARRAQATQAKRDQRARAKAEAAAQA